jgi:hypothetical protein
MSKKVQKPGRGRPVAFKTPNERRHVAKLVRLHGATGAVALLKAEGVTVTVPTVCKVAASLGVELKRGRRAA